MKKHIFGFALFSLIFASFALSFAFFYASPVARVSKVRQTEYQTERPVFCPKTQQDITYRVLNSQFDLDSGEFISNIHLSWNNRSEKAPKKIFVTTRLFNLENNKEEIFNATEVFTAPFGDFSGTTITVRHKEMYAYSDFSRRNFYVSFNFSSIEDSDNLNERNGDSSEFSEVLFIHGENSKIKK